MLTQPWSLSLYLKWKKKLIVFLQINLHINKTLISWKMMLQITPYIKDKTKLSTEYILPEFCIIDLWSEHPTPYIFSKSTWNPTSKKKILYFITPQNILYACMYMKILLRIKTLLCTIESLLNWIDYYIQIIFLEMQVWYDFKSQSIFEK